MVVNTNYHKKFKEVLLMTIIRQASLFSVQELYDMKPIQKI